MRRSTGVLPATVSGGGRVAARGCAAFGGSRLSVAARVIGAVLADLDGRTLAGARRGAAVAVAAKARAGAVLGRRAGADGVRQRNLLRVASGEFASGTRTLAQMAQEPQARWATPVAAQAAAAAVPQAMALAQALALGSAVLQDAVQSGATPQQPSASAQDGNAPAQASRAANAGGPQQGVPGDASAQGGGAPSSGGAAANAAPASSADAARVLAAYRQPDSAPAASTSDTAQTHRAGEAARQSDSPAATPASREVIHPQAVTLVHQQLDLLASAAFRWSGQAWPDVPMAWSIEEEQAKPDERGGANADADSQRRWSTTVSLVLPRLGEVDLHLSLSGPTVQAHLSARETATMARMRGDAGQLAKHFEAAGLQLQQLQVTAKAVA
jgi:hypothetical protein